ncbi:hypothetical protein [Caldimonas brevitalea]|uniref:Uncharacterized protein n=1 Tax=Caldimonas brevitalea TaxID=413882 RepID=A0A0G3BJT3_9BURK|nr:hypothetical protein [Caldimonas brevitalea]AKJ29652.1 hypothetical protein AAW51_2961 [Caldimonas brevitalea]
MQPPDGEVDPVVPPLQDDLDTLDAHRLLVVCLFISSFAIGTLYLAVGLFFAATGEGGRVVTPLTATIVAGAGGGFVSCLRRLYAFQDVFPRKGYERLFRRMNFYVLAYSSVPALVGMIGAVVVYLVFAAGLLQGDLFPAFECVHGTCQSFQDFIQYWSPTDAQAYAKAIVWGFIAGFSERLVPDILNRIGSGQSAGHATKVDKRQVE